MKTKIKELSEQEVYYRQQNLKVERRKEFRSAFKEFLTAAIIFIGVIVTITSLAGGLSFIFGWSRNFATQTEQDSLERRIEQLEIAPHFFVHTNYFPSSTNLLF